MNTATAILPAAALCAALLLPVSATAGEAAPLAALMRDFMKRRGK